MRKAGVFFSLKSSDVLFLPSVLWYLFYHLIIGASIWAQSHVSHYDGKYQKELLNENTESNTLLFFIPFILAQPGSVAYIVGNSKLHFLVDGRDLHPDI